MSYLEPIKPAGDAEATDLGDIRRSLRAMKVILKQPADHPYREQALVILRDSRAIIDRINGSV